jgi:hypothetical protein
MPIKQRIIKLEDIERSVLSYIHFDLWPVDLKINKGYQFFQMYSVQFDVHQGNGSEHYGWSVYSYVQFGLGLCGFHFKINSGQLHFMMYQSTKFEVGQANGSKYIE